MNANKRVIIGTVALFRQSRQHLPSEGPASNFIAPTLSFRSRALRVRLASRSTGPIYALPAPRSRAHLARHQPFPHPESPVKCR